MNILEHIRHALESHSIWTFDDYEQWRVCVLLTHLFYQVLTRAIYRLRTYLNSYYVNSHPS